MMPLTETSRIGLKTIWTLFRDAWLRGHEPNADRMCCSMALVAYRQMAWGAYLCTRNDDAYELYDHIAAVEHAYWLRDPHLDWYARQHRRNNGTLMER